MSEPISPGFAKSSRYDLQVHDVKVLRGHIVIGRQNVYRPAQRLGRVLAEYAGETLATQKPAKA